MFYVWSRLLFCYFSRALRSCSAIVLRFINCPLLLLLLLFFNKVDNLKGLILCGCSPYLKHLPDTVRYIKHVDVTTLSQRLQTCVCHTRAVYHKDVPEICAVSTDVLKCCVAQLGVP